jgi:hypothetical protein
MAKIDELKRVLTTKKVNEILEKEDKGHVIQRHEKLWFKNMPGVRKSNVPFAMTDDEILEYARCKLSVHYFAEKYCKIKREDSTIGKIKLRDYQKEIISLFNDNRFSILMASRQTGKCVSPSTIIKVRKEETGLEYKFTIGEFYYFHLQQQRKLTFLEQVKYFLYRQLKYMI